MLFWKIYLAPVTDSDFDKATDSFFDMLAYLPIKYFDKYKFGSRNDVMTAFSLLPPIIRYKTLEYLFSIEPDNIAVADKLVLSIMKANNPDDAMKWAIAHRQELERLSCVTEGGYNTLVDQFGEAIARETIASAPKNMYELCVSKIEQLRESINQNGTLYKTFEEA